MDRIQIGQRVRVIEGRLVHYRQVGTVVAAGDGGGWYVHLDYDADRPDAGIFFHAEELEAAPDAPLPPQRAAHWSAGAGLERRPDHATPAQPLAAADVTRVSTLMHEQADRLADQATQVADQAGAARSAAGHLDEQADQLRDRADRLHQQADHLRSQAEHERP